MDPAPVRLAELLVAFSTIADLGMGMPAGEAARTALVAVELARGQGCPEPEVAAVFYAALLQHIGCTAYSHEAALLFADETTVKHASMATDFTQPGRSSSATSRRSPVRPRAENGCAPPARRCCTRGGSPRATSSPNARRRR